jgi:hypothetical protein
MSKAIIESEIVIKNKKICEFYNQNKHINIEAANLLLIDFIQTMFNNIITDNTTNINAQLLSYMNENKTELNSIKNNISVINENISKLNSEMTNNIMLQFMNLKKEYIDDVSQVINNSSLNNNEKITAIMDKNSSHLIDKTTLILNEVIPKNQEMYNKQIQTNIKELHSLISDDTKNLIKTIDSDKSLTEFINSFEVKYNAMMQTIQQPLYAFFTASENRINQNIDFLKETTTTSVQTQNKLFEDLNEFLSKYNVSSNKGKYAEQNLLTILNSIYQSADIRDTSSIKSSGDSIMKRIDKPTILFENKEYKNNIDKEEIAKFINDVDTQKVHGIFLSQYSGIAFKQNYQIDIHKGCILVYIQNCEYSIDKIRIAVDIIDNLSLKIQELNIYDNDTSISKEVLDDINDEYNIFITQKESLLLLLKDFQKRITTQIEELKLPALDKYLSPKYAFVKDRNFMCDICNCFCAANKQSLSAHKRGCKKKTINGTGSQSKLENLIIIDTKTSK